MENDGLASIKNIMGEVQAPSQQGALDAPSLSPSLDKLGRAYATGKRKTSVARLWLKPGDGTITVNKKSYNSYFPTKMLQACVDLPLRLTLLEKRFSIFCTVKGGGVSGQAGAVRHALARALSFYKPDSKSKLKSEGLLTFDARRVERKKPGQRGARRRFQRSFR